MLIDALAPGPEQCRVLSLGTDLTALGSGIRNIGQRLNVDHYDFKATHTASSPSPDNDSSLVITHRGKWNPAYQRKDPVYDLVMADLSHLTSGLGVTVKALSASLAEKGRLSCSIPLGWKKGQTYPYFLNADTLVRIMNNHGLKPLSISTSRDPVTAGYTCNLTCVAELDYLAPYFDETRRLVKRYKFIPHHDPSFAYYGNWSPGGGHERIAKDAGSSFTWRGEATELLIVCEHHQWSGIGEFLVRGRRVTRNFYSWYGHTQPEEVYLSKVGPQTINLAGRPIGADPCSLGTELVVHGMLVR